MNKLETMQVFVRVAELNSFTRAAESLGLPKGSVSRFVQQLESTMGVRLLHRTTRRVLLTQDGEVFYARCKELLDSMNQLESMFQTAPSAITGRLRVDMPVGIAQNVVIPHLPAFLRQYPGIELELSSSDRLVEVVREGFDCVLRVGALKDSTLIARTLGAFSIVNCASPAYLARCGTPQQVDDLAQHALVHYALNLGSRAGFEYQHGTQTIWVKTGGQVAVNSTITYTAACLAGLGIIQVPRISAKHHLESGQMVEILPDYRPQAMPVSLIYPHRRNISKRVQIFMEWLGSIMKTYME